MQHLQHKLKSTETPCVGICSTIYGDDICRGCFRSLDEVTNWNGYLPEQKLRVLERLNQQISKVTASKLSITDADLLLQQCQNYHIRIREDFTPYTWAHALLRAGLHDIKDISKYGIKIHDKFLNLSLAKLIEIIDDELFSAAG